MARWGWHRVNQKCSPNFLANQIEARVLNIKRSNFLTLEIINFPVDYRSLNFDFLKYVQVNHVNVIFPPWLLTASIMNESRNSLHNHYLESLYASILFHTLSTPILTTMWKVLVLCRIALLTKEYIDSYISGKGGQNRSVHETTFQENVFFYDYSLFRTSSVQYLST